MNEKESKDWFAKNCEVCIHCGKDCEYLGKDVTGNDPDFCDKLLKKSGMKRSLLV